MQIVIAFARRNHACVNHNDKFACVYLRSRVFAFAFVCEYCSRSTVCTYMRIYMHDVILFFIIFLTLYIFFESMTVQKMTIQSMTIQSVTVYTRNN